MIRERLPGVPLKKLHTLLYYAQTHHLATFHQPLLSEAVSAWDLGPVVCVLWKAEDSGVDLPAAVDLEVLSHGEHSWRRADQTREPHGRVRFERK